MDVEEFFDRLYSHFYVHFPCYALYEPEKGFLTESAGDGTASLVLYTDEDLLEESQMGRCGEKPMPIGFHDAVGLGRVLGRLPKTITYVTFDPTPRFHRRYPVGVIRDSLVAASAESKQV